MECRSEEDDIKIIDSTALDGVLYGKWSQWGGKMPPAGVVKTRLSLISSESRNSAPPQVYFGISTLPISRIGIFAAEMINEGTEIGPYPGYLALSNDVLSPADDEKSWEVFDSGGEVKGILTAGSYEHPSWVTYIQCARHEQEQNLATFQVNGCIYYRVIRTIEVDEELLVWYGPQIPQSLGIPEFFTAKESWQKSPVEGTSVGQGSEKRLKCVVCRRGFNSRSNLRSHMRVHTLQRPFSCLACGRRFSQSSTLRNHLRLHTGEKPYKCYVCQSAYSQLAGLRAHQRSSRHRPSTTNACKSQGSRPIAADNPQNSIN